jgi:hypothetical protein
MNAFQHTLSFCAVTGFAVFAIGCANPDSDTKKSQSQTQSDGLDADQLYKAYSADKAAADAKYKYKFVVVSGTIQYIGKDFLDQTYIVIGGRGALDGVQCMFASGQEVAVARLSKGQRVTVKGEVSGTGDVGHVRLNKCELQ